jgi:putative Holliday junction resolvase
MRALALDIGEVRCGIAASDASGSVASPVRVLPTQEVLAGSRSWRLVLEDYEPDVLVCGLPKTMAGEEGPQAARIRKTAEGIAAACGLPLEFCDERLSSSEAKRILREEGLSERQMRGKVDMVAASLFLQAWLDATSASGERQGDACHGGRDEGR